ncbi:hypothetical protein ACOSP7_031298 [Xanthoceras sorbifolium]
MSGSSARRSHEDRGVEASASGHQGIILPQRGAMGAIILNQVDNLDHLKEVEVVNGVEILDNLPQAAYKGLHRKKYIFASAPSRIYRGSLKVMADSFQFPSGHQLLVPIVIDKAAYALLGFVPYLGVPHRLAELPEVCSHANDNVIKRNGLPHPNDNVIKYCFALRQCLLPKGSPEDVLHDGMHHQVVRASE